MTLSLFIASLLAAAAPVAVAHAGGAPVVTWKAPSAFVSGAPYVVDVEITAPEGGADLPGWLLTPAAFAIDGKDVAGARDAASIPLPAGSKVAGKVDLSKAIRELQTLLRDPAQTRFIVVTRAAEVPRLETVRLLAQLRRLQLATPALVVNARTLAPGRCAWCRATAAAERRELEVLRRVCGRRCAMIDTPLVAPPPRGVRQLNEWAATWLQPKAPTSTPSSPRTRARA